MLVLWKLRNHVLTCLDTWICTEYVFEFENRDISNTTAAAAVPYDKQNFSSHPGKAHIKALCRGTKILAKYQRACKSLILALVKSISRISKIQHRGRSALTLLATALLTYSFACMLSNALRKPPLPLWGSTHCVKYIASKVSLQMFLKVWSSAAVTAHD